MSGWFVSISTDGLVNLITSDVLRVVSLIFKITTVRLLYRIIQYEVFKVQYIQCEALKSSHKGFKAESNGLKWTRTTDLTLIRRAL